MVIDNIPFIFDIQRASFEDGKGIRTVVFFKGCPLECEWCHNPESQSPEKEILWYSDLCKNCKECSYACKKNAIRNNDYEYKIDKAKCRACGECVKACDYNALKTAGKEYEAESLVNIILKDKLYFDVSGGGVTFSGGEPLMFMEFLSDVCKYLKEKDIDITLQTCGYFDFDEFGKHISPYINTIYFDIKIADNELHKTYTGKGNKLILENLNKLFSPKKHKIIIRTPLIDGISNTPKNLKKIKEIINNYDYDGYEELLFNNSYNKKLESLGRNKLENIKLKL